MQFPPFLKKEAWLTQKSENNINQYETCLEGNNLSPALVAESISTVA